MFYVPLTPAPGNIIGMETQENSVPGMVCFCKHSTTRLALVLPKLDVAASLAASASAVAQMQLLANWLAAAGLPAAPWQPDPAWLELSLPKLSLNVSAMATLSAFAQLRAGALVLGIDILVPGQANALTRLAATLNARLMALAAVGAGEIGGAALLNPGAWAQLSAALNASAQVQAALQLGLFPTPPPSGPPLSIWRGFLSQLRALLPMIAVAGQLGLSASVNLAEELGPMLRTMLGIRMPALTASMSLMASLTTALTAVASLKLGLGVDPLQLGLPAVRLLVSARVTATADAVRQQCGMSLARLLAMLLAELPRPPYCPTLMAPPAVVHAAAALNLPPITWQIPAISALPVLRVGLPVVALTAQLQSAMGIAPALTPCGGGCDAAALLGAALAA
jgi:hypothetical protein